MPFSQPPALLFAWLTEITAALDCRSAPRLLRLFLGALSSKGRCTVLSKFRPAGTRDDHCQGYVMLYTYSRAAKKADPAG